MYMYIYMAKRYNSIITDYQKIINLLDNTPNQPSKYLEQEIRLK